MKVRVAVALVLGSVIVARTPCTAEIEEPRRFDAANKSCVVAPQGICQDFFVRNDESCDKLSRLSIVRSPIGVSNIVEVATNTKNAAHRCYRERLKVKPQWISNATWVDHLSQLLVVDPDQNAVLLYSQQGALSAFPGTSAIGRRRVDSAARGMETYLLKFIGTTAAVFDGSLRVISSDLNLRGKDESIGSIYDWEIGAGKLFGFGTIKSGTGDNAKFAAAFFEVGLIQSPLTLGSVRNLVPFDYIDYYLIGNKYVAVNDEYAFFLKMGDPAEIYRVSRAGGVPEKLKASLPGGISKVPRIKNVPQRPADLPALYGEIEDYEIPVGLYGFGKELFLVARKPDPGGTAWWLYELDPKSGIVLETLRLPTNASHITVVPSPDYWFIFEKGSVKAGGSQDIESLIAIPTSSIIKGNSISRNDQALVRECRMSKGGTI